MNVNGLRFAFEPEVSLTEAEMSLHLAMFAVEGLVGRVRVRLDTKYHLDESNRTIVIDTRMPTGQMVARVFTGLLSREFGEDAFHAEHVNELPQQLPQEVQT
jgi:hypothetical protein